MNYPRMTNDPYADADALDRYHEESRCDCIKCNKCGYGIEEGEEYYFISIPGLDEIILCENCISDFKTTHLEEE